MTNYRTTVAKSGVLFARLVQVSLSGLAAIFILGGIMGDMAAFAFLVLGPVALVLLAFVAVVEFLMVRPIQRRWGGSVDG